MDIGWRLFRRRDRDDGHFPKETQRHPGDRSDKRRTGVAVQHLQWEQTLCIKDRETGNLHELMLIRTRADLNEICDANGIDPDSIRKIY